jgi:phosphatidylglycerophosphate synthase
MSQGRLGSGASRAITVGRLGLVPVIALSFMSAPAITTPALLLFMFADLFDGVLARRRGDDGLWRRALDSTVDRIAIDACFIAAAVTGAMPVLLVVAFLVRDLYCAGICASMMRERRVVLKMDLPYRALSCALAGWAFAAPFVSANARLAGAVALFAASLLAAVDLTFSVRQVRRAPTELQDAVVSAAALRRGRIERRNGAGTPVAENGVTAHSAAAGSMHQPAFS